MSSSCAIWPTAALSILIVWTYPPFDLDVSDDPFDRLDELSPPNTCEHPSLGFEIKECHIRKRGFVSGIIPNTTASRIRNVRRKYIGAFVVSINDVAVFTAASILEALQAAATSEEQSFKIVFAPDRYIPVVDRHLDQPLHLSVDQLRTVSTILSMSSSPRPEPFDNSLVFPANLASSTMITSSFASIPEHNDPWDTCRAKPGKFHSA
ncbi:hypothetical protein MHU86_19293 [Fragilaria crotonensis]|nr:hypothetical protein MHU86_19293 [Fragilaria crotonensis]